MKTNIKNSATILGRWTHVLGAMLVLALMVPAAVFSQPTLVLPLDATLNVSTGPTLSWSAVPLAVTYHLQVSLSSVFGTTVYDNDVSAVSQVVAPVLANATLYYWHVSDDVHGLGNYSAYQSFTTNPTPVNLRTAADFRILAQTGITGGAGSHITGDIGVSSTASTITEFSETYVAGAAFSTSDFVTGKIYAFDYADPTPTKMTTAVFDMGTAYDYAATLSPAPVGTFLNAGVGEIGGLNLTPGLYKWNSAVTISDDLTLTGNSTDVWIFQIAGTLGMADGKQIVLVGALASNIFWQVADQVTLVGTAAMKGIILGKTGIAFGANGTLDGRALAQTLVTLITNTVLPVELIAFTATANRMNADLRWSTATEVNNYGFAVERKVMDNWNKVGFVDGAGTTNAPKEYSFSDNNLASGKYSYRLKQIDRDGKFEYSKSVEVAIGGTAPAAFGLSQNYPNPFNPTTVISYQLPVNSQVTLKVYDVLGNEVATLVNGEMKAGSYSVPFNTTGTHSLPSGVYFYRLEVTPMRDGASALTGSFVSTKRLILMK
jgi:hypothetical protein